MKLMTQGSNKLENEEQNTSIVSRKKIMEIIAEISEIPNRPNNREN